jgi:hypothetical protein
MIIGPFQYLCRSGIVRYVPGTLSAPRLFDTDDPLSEWDLPDNFVVPITGLAALDEESAAALDAVRAPYAGQNLPGLGYVPPKATVWEV